MTRKTKMEKRPKFQYYPDKSGGSQPWRWRLLGGNGETIADGGEGYASKSNVKRAIATVRENARDADVEETDE